MENCPNTLDTHQSVIFETADQSQIKFRYFLPQKMTKEVLAFVLQHHFILKVLSHVSSPLAVGRLVAWQQEGLRN